MLDAVESRLIAAPSVEGGWLLTREGEELVLRVLAGRGLSVARGVCVHHDGSDDGGVARATIEISRSPIRQDASIDCRIERSERKQDGAISAERAVRWTFDLADARTAFTIESDSEDPPGHADAEQAAVFARAVASTLAVPDW